MFHFFKNNLILKILAIVCAVLVWIFVTNEGFRVDYLEREIPVKVYNIREDLALARDLGKVKLKVRAPQVLWPKLTEESVEAYIDLKTFDPGEYDVEVKISLQDPKIQVLEKKPEKVHVILEPILAIEKGISLGIKGKAGEGYYPGEAKISPYKVEIRGAKSILAKVYKVKAEVELKGEVNEVKEKTKLKAVNFEEKEINYLTIIPEEIEVTVPILKETGVKNVGVKAKISGQPQSGFWIEKIEVLPSVVIISGNVEKIRQFNFIETPEIDISGISESYEKKVNLVPFGDIQKIEPSLVTVKVILGSSQITRSFEAAVNFKNLNPKLKVDLVSPNVVLIVLQGPVSVINSLSQKPIFVNLDLKERRAGSHSFSISSDLISLPAEINLKSIETKEVKVVISQKS